jgi:transcriptional regulator NrdR family protein
VLKQNVTLYSSAEKISQDILDTIMLKKWDEITTKKISVVIMNMLIEIDHVSYIRFALLSKHFDSIEQIRSFLDIATSQVATSESSGS